MCKSGIYQITLKEDGRSYIGSALNIESRWKQHRDNSKRLKNVQVIARAIAKYGVDAFSWTILEECPIDNLLEREQYWLDTIRPFTDEGRGFNVRKVADSNIGIKRSIESRIKQSITMTGVPKTLEHRKNMSNNWHKNRNDAYYAALSDRIKGENNPAKRKEVREKISKSMTGKSWKDDIDRVRRHKEQRQGKKRSPETREKMKIAQQKNNTRSDAAKEKFYLSQRTLYEVTKPDQSTFQMYSRELKEYCRNNELQYSNLITTAKTNKVYKKGWKVRVIG